MLDSFQRTTVERVREYKGKISLVFDDDEQTILTIATADIRYNRDLALALQSYYNRHQNNK